MELILSTESRVIATNISDFKEQAEKYLLSLTQTFETDEDFGRAKEEVKTLKELEDKTREAIDSVLNGNQDIAKLIDTAKEIAERFRTERLTREKLVKSKEAEIKQQIANQAINEITEARNQLVKESDISLALEMTISKQVVAKRIDESQKNKRTIDSLTKAVNVEKQAIISEMSLEVSRLTNRLEQINAQGKIWLFNDTVKLIASNDDLAPIIQQRIDAEQQREAELKAKAEQEALERAEAQANLKAKLQQEQANLEAKKNEVTSEHSPQTQAQTANTETKAETSQFILKIPAQEIPFTGTLEQLREYFAPVKALGIQATISKR